VSPSVITKSTLHPRPAALALDGTLDDDTGALEDALGVIYGSRERLLDVELGTLERTLEGLIEALLEALLDGSAEEILADIAQG